MTIKDKLSELVETVVEVDINDGVQRKPLDCPIGNSIKKAFDFVDHASVSNNVLLRPKQDTDVYDSAIIRMGPTIQSWLRSFDWGLLPVKSFRMVLRFDEYENYYYFRWCTFQH